MPRAKRADAVDVEEKKTKTAKKTVGEDKAATDEVLDEKELLKEAEEREKERKAEEKEKREEEKEAEKEKKKEEVEEKQAKKSLPERVKPRHGKKHREAAKLIEKDKEYPLNEAIDLVLRTSTCKFDATVELHARINKKENNIRGMVNLPGGVAKEKTILEVTEKNIEDIIAKVKTGKIEFDVMIADLKVMPKLAPLAKILGPKGLMPSPKAGTAVEDVAKAAEELRGGKIEYRADKDNIVHVAIGKISFGAEKVSQNYSAVVGALPNKKIESIFLTATMGPSVKVVRK